MLDLTCDVAHDAVSNDSTWLDIASGCVAREHPCVTADRVIRDDMASKKTIVCDGLRSHDVTPEIVARHPDVSTMLSKDGAHRNVESRNVADVTYSN